MKCKIYTESKGACPKCGESVDIEGGQLTVDLNCAWQPVTCLACGCKWYDVYEWKQAEVYEDEEE